ncbi:WYL domain-containing protein [Granulosicoccus sp.]|nr:WYL domain-containing protein [Granulosicoccus sp.]MDB4222785.1 WYL domain-containing protein [Granulosicoccus sp.]
MQKKTSPTGRNLAPRFKFIEWRLFWEGHLNRSDLEERFGISTPQASVDLRNYREVAGSNLEYNATEKRFVVSKSMKPKFLRVSANRLLIQLSAFISGVLRREDLQFSEVPAADVVPEIIRDVQAEVLQVILNCIRSGNAVSVQYQSLTSTKWRDIAPHALAFDGNRWHARAWCCEHLEFRDFVLTRIKRADKQKEVSFNPAHDLAWHRKIELHLCPHPALNAEQSDAIERDYDMSKGVRKIEMRIALAFYFIRLHNLDLETLEPARAQIILANLPEVEAVIADARKQSKQLNPDAQDSEP